MRQLSWLAASAHALARLVFDPILWGLLAVLPLGALACSLRPFALPVPLGQHEGRHNDAPFLAGFNDAELQPETGLRYRWSTPRASLVFRDLPGGTYLFETRLLLGGPATLTSGALSMPLPQALAPRQLRLLLPAPQGAPGLRIDSSQFQADAADPRSLGLSLSGGRLSSVALTARPPWRPLGAALALLLTIWLATRALGGSRREAAALLGLLSLALLAALACDPLRFGLAAWPLLLASISLLAGLLLFAPLLALLERRLGLLVERPWRRWLLLASAGLLALLLAGRFFPGAMEGDILFHRNRLVDTLRGELFLTANNRGVLFPYPPALYLLLAPLTLLASPVLLLQISSALLTALGLPALFLLLLRATGRPRGALFAALLYGLFPVNFMPFWWSFNTHIFTQLLALLICAYLTLAWERLARPRVWLGLVGLGALTSLGHFGFYLNLSLLLSILALLRVIASWHQPGDRRNAWALLLALLVVQLLVWSLYLSGYLELFESHRQALQSGGVGAISDRALATTDELLRSLFVDGFWGHYAALPLLLVPLGLAALARGERSRPLALVIGGCFVVSALIGSVPFLTGSSLSTRWLTFSAWGLAACAGVALDALCSRGRWPRLLASAAVLFVGWWGLRLSLLAMAYYVRPPEPF